LGFLTKAFTLFPFLPCALHGLEVTREEKSCLMNRFVIFAVRRMLFKLQNKEDQNAKGV